MLVTLFCKSCHHVWEIELGDTEDNPCPNCNSYNDILRSCGPFRNQGITLEDTIKQLELAEIKEES